MLITFLVGFFGFSTCYMRSPLRSTCIRGLTWSSYKGLSSALILMSELPQGTLRRPGYCIICICSESCLWSIVRLPGSYVFHLTFRKFSYGTKGRTAAIVFPFRPVKYLSRESKKLIVMISESGSAIR